MGNALPRLGNIFEGGVDLTVLPCSSKGTVSSATARWLDVFSIPHPTSLAAPLGLGEISELIEFPREKRVTKYVVFAASVMNDSSSSEAIERIARALGNLTARDERIRIVETPLLGTGSGGLTAEAAGRSLYRGFLATASNDAILYVFVMDKERLRVLEAAMGPDSASRLWDAIGIRPGFMGFSVDVKKLFRRKQ